MQEPTQEEIRVFWEWCGFGMRYLGSGHLVRQRRENEGIEEAFDYCFASPEGQRVTKFPSLDLNNLFRYAVPKLLDDPNSMNITFSWEKDNRQGAAYKLENALFWALDKVRENGQEKEE